VIIYRTDGQIALYDFQGKPVPLQVLHAAVGGYIELVPGSYNRAFCNEDGHRLGLPVNQEASRRFAQLLVGDVVELEQGELEEDQPGYREE